MFKSLHGWFTLLAAACVMASAAPARALTLVRDGRAVSVIVTRDAPYPAQQLAAEQLQYHLARMTGVSIPIVRETDLQPAGRTVMMVDDDAPAPMEFEVPAGRDGRTLILVGGSERLKALGIDTAELPRESIVIRTLDNALVLAGEDGGEVDPRSTDYDSSQVRTGTLYAVFEFLEQELGCRWLWPGRTGEVIPRRDTVEIGDLDIRKRSELFRRHFRSGLSPATARRIEARAPRYMAANQTLLEQMRDDERLWKKRMRLGQRRQFSLGHSFTDWWDRYRQQYPDIFALQPDGRRGLPTPTYRTDFVKLCVSNPQVIELMIEQFLALRQENPDAWLLQARPNDGSLGWCTCADCRAWDRPLDDEMRRELAAMGWTDDDIERTFGTQPDGLPGSLSPRYLRFWNRLGRRLAEVALDAYVVTYAYSRYTYVPLGMEAEPNILVGFHDLQFYPLSPQEHHRQLSQFIGWKQMGMEMLFWRPNSMIFAPGHGIPWHITQMAEDMQRLIDHGVSATDFDSLTGHWSTAAPIYYAMAQLQWHTQLTAEQVLADFYQSFGPSADAVRHYMAHWERVWTEAYARDDLDEVLAAVEPIGGRLARRKAVAVLLVEADFDVAAQYLRAARRQADASDDPDLLQRLKVLDLGLRHGLLTWRASRLANQRDPAAATDFTQRWPIVRDLFETRRELGRLGAHNIFWLSFWEAVMHDVYGTGVYYDFMDSGWQPVMTPPRAGWVLRPDPDDEGERAGWHQTTIEQPDVLRRGRFDNPFAGPWDELQPIRRWKHETGRDAVSHAWYQVRFTLPADRQANDALYIPLIRGETAKVWIDGEPVRQLTRDDLAAGDPQVMALPEVGPSLLLTIKVSSPDIPGGLIGPVYLARPAE